MAVVDLSTITTTDVRFNRLVLPQVDTNPSGEWHLQADGSGVTGRIQKYVGNEQLVKKFDAERLANLSRESVKSGEGGGSDNVRSAASTAAMAVNAAGSSEDIFYRHAVNGFTYLWDGSAITLYDHIRPGVGAVADTSGAGGTLSHENAAAEIVEGMRIRLDDGDVINSDGVVWTVDTSGAPTQLPSLLVDDVSTLLAIPEADIDTALVYTTKGYTIAGVGSEGYRYDPTSTATISGGDVLPGFGGVMTLDANGSFNGTTGGNTNVGRWLAVNTDRMIRVVQADGILRAAYLASGDATTWHEPMKQAIETSLAGDTVSFPQSVYMESIGEINRSTIDTGITIRGNNSTIKLTQEFDYGIFLERGDNVVSDLTINCGSDLIASPATKACRGLYLAGTSAVVDRVSVVDSAHQATQANFLVISDVARLTSCYSRNPGRSGYEYNGSTSVEFYGCDSDIFVDRGEANNRHYNITHPAACSILIDGGRWRIGAFHGGAGLNSSGAARTNTVLRDITFDYENYLPHSNTTVGILKVGESKSVHLERLKCNAPGTDSQAKIVLEGGVDLLLVEGCRFDGDMRLLGGGSVIKSLVIRDSIIGDPSYLTSPSASPELLYVVPSFNQIDCLKIENSMIYGVHQLTRDVAGSTGEVSIRDSEIYLLATAATRFMVDAARPTIGWFTMKNTKIFADYVIPFGPPTVGTQAEVQIGETIPPRPGFEGEGAGLEIIEIDITGGSWAGTDAVGTFHVRGPYNVLSAYSGDFDSSGTGRIAITSTVNPGFNVYAPDPATRLAMTSEGTNRTVHWDDKLWNGPSVTVAARAHPAASPTFGGLIGLPGARVINKNYPDSTTRVPYWDWDETNSEWVPSPESVINSTALGNAADTINTNGKYEGRRVKDTAGNRFVYADGPNPTDPWRDAVGTITHTPA